MVTSGMPSARKKLERAQVHLTTLHTEIDRFRDASPYEFDITSDGNTRWKADFYVTATVTHVRKTPDSWALITGDILTNLRAALDHAIHPHVRAKKPDLQPHHIQFPIEDGKSQWENKVKWFQGTVSKVVGKYQPYRNDAAERPLHPLRVLRELVNMDKHRELVIASYAMQAFELGQHNLDYTVVSKVVHNQSPMEAGQVIAQAHLRLAGDITEERQEQIPYSIECSECIDIPGCLGPQCLLDVMDDLSDAVGVVLDELERAKC